MSVLGAGVSSFFPATPVGERCWHGCIHHDGRPNNNWDVRNIDFKSEMNSLEDHTLDTNLSWAQHEDYRARMMSTMALAAEGRVAFGESCQGSVIRESLVELKPIPDSDRPVFGKVPRLIRLYIGEPAIMPRLLVALLLATKAHGEEGLVEQDIAIDSALERAYSWTPET